MLRRYWGAAALAVALVFTIVALGSVALAQGDIVVAPISSITIGALEPFYLKTVIYCSVAQNDSIYRYVVDGDPITEIIFQSVAGPANACHAPTGFEVVNAKTLYWINGGTAGIDTIEIRTCPIQEGGVGVAASTPLSCSTTAPLNHPRCLQLVPSKAAAAITDALVWFDYTYITGATVPYSAYVVWQSLSATASPCGGRVAFRYEQPEIPAIDRAADAAIGVVGGRAWVFWFANTLLQCAPLEDPTFVVYLRAFPLHAAPSGIQVVGDRLYWCAPFTTTGYGSSGTAATYCTIADDGTVNHRLYVASPDIEIKCPEANMPRLPYVAGRTLYWLDQVGKIYSCPLTGGSGRLIADMRALLGTSDAWVDEMQVVVEFVSGGTP